MSRGEGWRRRCRHPELVSGSIQVKCGAAEKWTLKRVQGDGMGTHQSSTLMGTLLEPSAQLLQPLVA